MALLSPATALLLVAFVLFAWDASRRDRHPGVVLLGLMLVALGVFVRLFTTDGGAIVTTIGLLLDGGLGFLVGGAIMAMRGHTNVRSFILLGLFALTMAGALYGLHRLFRPTAPDPFAVLLVELGPDDHLREIEPLLARHGATAEQAFPTVTLTDDADLAQVFLVRVPARREAALTAALTADGENVDHVAMNRRIGLAPVEQHPVEIRPASQPLADDPRIGEQWALDAIGAHAAHARLRDQQPARKAVVAIVDTGVDGRHEDLHATFRTSPGATDAHGHGTHCAGIAGAATNNGRGVASLNWEGRFVEVAGYPALDAQGFGNLESAAQAIIDAAQDDADVISLSLGEYSATPPKVLTDAVTYALRRGALVVASAGNNNRDATDHAPSNIDGVIAVAAVGPDLTKASFSNTIATMRRPIAAPGVDILSLKPRGTYVAMSGTSMATPFVAGLLGVLRALRPDLTAEQAYDLLHATGRSLDETPRIGRLIQADAALTALLDGAS